MGRSSSLAAVFHVPSDSVPQPSTVPAPADPEIDSVLEGIRPMKGPSTLGDREASTTIVIDETDLEDEFLEPEQESDPVGPGKSITGVLITGRQDGMFAAFDQPEPTTPSPPPEISPSAGKSIDDLEREAITESLKKLGFKIEVGSKFTTQDWKDLRTMVLEHKWIEDIHRLVQVIHLILSISSHHTKERLNFSSAERRNPKFLVSKLMERLRDMGLKPIMDELALQLPNLPERLPPKLPAPKKP